MSDVSVEVQSFPVSVSINGEDPVTVDVGNDQVNVTLTQTAEFTPSAGAGDMLAANNLSDVVSVSTSRANLGLGGAAVLNVGTTAGTVSAGDDSRITGAAQKSSNLSDLSSASSARTNLGLGGAAVLSVGTSTGTVAAGDDLRITGAAQKASNLSDLGSAATARTNLGLGTSSTTDIGTSAGTACAGDDSRVTGALQSTSNLSDIVNAATARTNLGLGNSSTLNVGTSTGTVAAGDDARLSVVADQTGNSGKFLTTDGSATSWDTLAGGGDMLAANNLSDVASASTARTNLGLGNSATRAVGVTSADVAQGDTVPSQATHGGKFLTTNGTITSWGAIPGGGDMLAANNLSDVASASTARTNLGLAIGTNVQAYADELGKVGVKGSDIASSSAPAIGAGTGQFIDITGTTGITGFDTIAAGITRVLRFTGALNITHNGTSLQLPGSSNIATVAGDVGVFVSLGSGNWKCIHFYRISGLTLLSSNNLSELASASTSRTNLGATTVGGNIFTLTNPSQVCFVRTNADNTVTARTAAQTLSDISAFGSVTVQTFTSSGTYTPTSGMKYCRVRVQAPGGGGGGADGAGTSSVFGETGAGGGGGEYAEGWVSAATIGANQTITIGAAGTAGSDTGGDGGTGGTTSLGAIITCIGGSGGTGSGSNATSSQADPGGVGGTGGSGGSFRVPGGRGSFGMAGSFYNGSDSGRAGGPGGHSVLGHGAYPTAVAYGTGSDAAGVNGSNYGGGGSGAIDNDTTGSAGGTGGAGIIIIEEFI